MAEWSNHVNLAKIKERQRITQKEEAGYKSKLRSCSQNHAQQWRDSQDAHQVAVIAALAKSCRGLKRSVTGRFLRDQRTGFRASFPPVSKIRDNKSTAVLSNLNQKFLGEALIIWILVTPYLPFPQHMEHKCPLPAELSLSRNWLDLDSKGYPYFPISIHFPHRDLSFSWPNLNADPLVPFTLFSSNPSHPQPLFIRRVIYKMPKIEEIKKKEGSKKEYRF